MAIPTLTHNPFAHGPMIGNALQIAGSLVEAAEPTYYPERREFLAAEQALLTQTVEEQSVVFEPADLEFIKVLLIRLGSIATTINFATWAITLSRRDEAHLIRIVQNLPEDIKMPDYDGSKAEFDAEFVNLSKAVDNRVIMLVDLEHDVSSEYVETRQLLSHDD